VFWSGKIEKIDMEKTTTTTAKSKKKKKYRVARNFCGSYFVRILRGFFSTIRKTTLTRKFSPHKFTPLAKLSCKLHM